MNDFADAVRGQDVAHQGSLNEEDLRRQEVRLIIRQFVDAAIEARVPVARLHLTETRKAEEAPPELRPRWKWKQRKFQPEADISIVVVGELNGWTVDIKGVNHGPHSDTEFIDTEGDLYQWWAVSDGYDGYISAYTGSTLDRAQALAHRCTWDTHTSNYDPATVRERLAAEFRGLRDGTRNAQGHRLA